MAAALAGAALLLAVSGCSGGGSTGGTTGHDPLAGGSLHSPATPGSSNSVPTNPAATMMTSQMKVRFADFFSTNGKPGPALDIYDTQVGTLAKPMVANLTYGEVSSYVAPDVPTGTSVGGPIATFYALPTGEDPVADKADAQGVGGFQDTGSHPQLTLIFTPAEDSEPNMGPLYGLSYETRVEKGDFNGSKAPVAPPAAAGKADILVDDSPVTNLNTGSFSLYLMNDDSCAPPLNGDTLEPGVPLVFSSATDAALSSYAIFETDPGAHQISIVSWTSTTPPTCADLTAKQGATNVTLAAGQQVEVYVYGTSATDLHLVVAPLAS